MSPELRDVLLGDRPEIQTLYYQHPRATRMHEDSALVLPAESVAAAT